MAIDVPVAVTAITRDAITSVEIRERYERRIDRDFLSSVPGNRSDLYSRLRLTYKSPLDAEWSGEAQYQFAHDALWTPQINRGFSNSDIALLNVQRKTTDWILTIGRQRMSIGTELLIEKGEWSNIGRSYDAIRLSNARWDFWGGKIGVSPVGNPRNVRIGGISYRSRLGETVGIYKHDDTEAGGILEHGTFSHRYGGNWGRWKAEGEAVYQTGRHEELDHEAWALHGNVQYRVNPNLTAYLEGNSASGGSNSTTHRTFDNLYPANHPRFGIMDMQSLRNMNEVAVGLDHTINNRLRVIGSYHTFSLRDTRDGWYGPTGINNNGFYIDPTGTSGRQVGTEIDLEAFYQIDKGTQLRGGIGLFTPGTFIKNMNGGSADNQFWGFVQLQKRL